MNRAVLVLVGLVWLLGACGSDSSSPSADAETAGGAALDGGAEVYAASCASCHGVGLRGTDKGPSLLSVVYEPDHHGDDSFRAAIANGSPQHHWGFGDMLAIEGLSDADVDAVIGYVRAEQEHQGFEN